MDKRLIVLKLFLNELKIPDDITTVDDRKRVQKAVYLGQLSGIDIGYRFGWYKMGPYSPALTKDYYSLAEATWSGDKDYEDKELRSEVKSKLITIASLLTPPDTVKLSQEDWLELISSYHFLRRVSNRSDDDAKNILQKEKPHLISFVDEAKNKLSAMSLLTD